MPGTGSLAAGRRSGYVELLLAFIGVALTLVFGTRFLIWFAQNWNSLHSQDADPLATFSDMWMAGRWAFLGIFIFPDRHLLESADQPPNPALCPQTPAPGPASPRSRRWHSVRSVSIHRPLP